MNEFKVELCIDNGNEENIKISRLNEKETEHWKKNMEARALSEYYKRKIKVSVQKKLISKSGVAIIIV